MPLIVDGILRDQGEAALSQAVREEIAALERSNRYVKRLAVNSKEKSLDEFRADHHAVSGDDTVDITTCSLDELIQDSMESAYEITPKLYQTLQFAVERLRVGDWSNGASNFAIALDGLQWTITTLAHLGSLHPGPSTVHDLSAEGNRVVPQLLEAWENGDKVLLADVIQYELLPWLNKWFDAIQLFRQQMRLEQMKKPMS